VPEEKNREDFFRDEEKKNIGSVAPVSGVRRKSKGRDAAKIKMRSHHPVWHA
jgi:hypothetical protein